MKLGAVSEVRGLSRRHFLVVALCCRFATGLSPREQTEDARNPLSASLLVT